MKVKSLMRALALTSVAVIGGAVMAEAGTVTGTVGYLERIALPPGAVLEVRLLDISRMDVAADMLSSQRFAMTGVPQPFALSYDDALIDQRFTYSLSASILIDGKETWRSVQVYPVLTRDAPNATDMVVKRMSGDAAEGAAGSLDNTAWEVTELAGAASLAEKHPTMQFAEGGGFSANSGCNTLAGEVRPVDGKLTFPKAMAMTMMACVPPYDEQERAFVDALGQVAGYVRDGDTLRLTDAGGQTVMSMTATK